MHVVVIGAGVYGLGASFYLKDLDPTVSVTLLERHRVGHSKGRYVSTCMPQQHACFLGMAQ
jgi:glycine/D-amino acid oxidase-like deaminating enzyme